MVTRFSPLVRLLLEVNTIRRRWDIGAAVADKRFIGEVLVVGTNEVPFVVACEVDVAATGTVRTINLMANMIIVEAEIPDRGNLHWLCVFFVN